jgi:3-deoxy-D-manno-octulosonate 8-phosphate phosphatase (KDO 8-P phosphatase)
MAAGKKLAKKARRIKMLLLDVDGVMTDGGIYYSANGSEMKRFNAQDGYGIARAREHGLKIAIISGRTTPVVDARARDLSIDDLFQGADDKVSVMRELQKRNGFADNEFAFMGDDLFDLPLLTAVGLSAAPGDARPEVRECVDYVADAKGGHGAVREFIDLIIQSQTT